MSYFIYEMKRKDILLYMPRPFRFICQSNDLLSQH